ncbi:MAG: hypothetical protein HKM24_06950, partial [Gammaproteobacteria bacterium]|nr:hypothetical protein [Gammaproteobacteria bacterium]
LWGSGIDVFGSQWMAGFINIWSTWPLVRIGWKRPHRQNIPTFAVFVVVMALSMLAMDEPNGTTLIYAAIVGGKNLFLTAMLLLRRRVVASETQQQTNDTAGA